MLDEIKTYEFLKSVGLVTICAALVTLVLTSVMKFILTKTRIINNNTEATKKDIILSRIGRLIGLLSYTGFYVLNVMYIEKVSLVIDVKLITSLLSGGTLTLIVSKGIYTMIRQMEKKNNVYEKLEVANETIDELEKEIELFSKSKIKDNSDNEVNEKKREVVSCENNMGTTFWNEER